MIQRTGINHATPIPLLWQLGTTRLGLGMCPVMLAMTPTRAALAHALATAMASNSTGHLVVELHGVTKIMD